jgi:hypothetical protein
LSVDENISTSLGLKLVPHTSSHPCIFVTNYLTKVIVSWESNYS